MWEMRKSTNAQGQTPRRGTCEFRSQYNHNAKVKDIRLFRPYRNLEASQHSVYTTNQKNKQNISLVLLLLLLFSGFSTQNKRKTAVVKDDDRRGRMITNVVGVVVVLAE